MSIFQSDLSLETKLERARMELLDLSARNRLLNVPRFSAAAKTVEVVDEKSPEIFRMLIGEGKAFSFISGQNRKSDLADADGEDELAELPQPEPDEPVDEHGIAGRHSDTKLQTRMTSKGLQSRLLDLYHDARTLEEEQGVNVLYLALGLLKWTDPTNAANVRHAPLVLVPVRLERGAAGEKFRLRSRQEEQAANLSLEAYLDRVHSLRLPPFELSEDFDISAYMNGIGEAVASKEGWEVRPDDIILGFFSFAKFLMYRDLDPENWPGRAGLTQHRIIRSLLTDGFEGGDALIPEGRRIDDFLSTSDMLHVVDCDSSQTLAVHEVRSGRDLVIQGPPGTGKSQTIANIIASAIADGKTVLFVAEKMAALEVVKRRLDQAGVGDACLELHSNKANKRLVLNELKRVWELGSPQGDFPDGVARRLTDARDILNAHADRMHLPHPHAVLTPYELFGHLARLRATGRRPSDVTLGGVERWTPDDRRIREELLSELSRRVQDIGCPDQHPWRGIGLRMVLATSVERIMERLSAMMATVSAWCASREVLAHTLELQVPTAFSDTPALVSLARLIASAPSLDPTALASPIWTSNLSDVVRLVAVGRELAQLSARLEGKVTAAGLVAPVEDLIPLLSKLPMDFGVAAFGRVNALVRMLPRLMDEVRRLAAELGSSAETFSLVAIDRLVATGERVAAAPDASPEAFAATVWDSGVEQAGDLAQAVAALELARHEIGALVTDVAWTTDVVEARQALATRTGLMKRLNGDWRRASALIKTVLRNPQAPLSDVLKCLDALGKGQTALRVLADGDAFGLSAFGADWRGDKSASAPLIALVEWMRTLKGLGAAPRLIASKAPERSLIGDRSSAVKKLVEGMRADLSALWSDLGEHVSAFFGDALTADRADLAVVWGMTSELALADRRCAGALSIEADLPECIGLLRLIVAYQDVCTALAEGEQLGSSAFGSTWVGARSDWAALARASEWIASHPNERMLASRIDDRSALSPVAGEIERIQALWLLDLKQLLKDLETASEAVFGSPFVDHLRPEDVALRLGIWLENSERLSKWVAYRDRAESGRSLGLAAIVDLLHFGRLAPEDALPTYEMAYFEALLTDCVRFDPELGRFDGTLHGAVARDFAALDKQRIIASSVEVVRAHHRRIPQPSGVGPVGVLRGEMARRRGHMPIRSLMQKASPAVQALKPVLMMSPLSVAQFLTPGHMSFDLLVMDEASQIQPVDALGAIARCRQVVVVGDEKQLPPTKFFSKMVGGAPDDDDMDGAQVADIESILGLFTARGLPQRMLRWHYRSRHQSLIAVSNSQFYESKLFIVPSPYTQEAGMGLRFHHIPDGVFNSSEGKGTNPVEARVVAEAVMRHAKSQPGLSLGVAAFSANQRRAIQDAVELLRRLNPDTEDFFHAHPSEPFFTKNLENVQGDERDVIMISVGYAKNPQGYMAMRFGPLGADGGERRLNVLISRAKQRCDVFASITDEDIDLERGKGKGVFAFKLFLHYARTGKLALAVTSGREQESVFEEQVGDALRARGYQVHAQVGIAGFFIDLAIGDANRPGRYLLGIECDGAAYHSSRSARDRDRLRQAVLEDHGWIIHRIWSADWFQRPNEQLEGTVAAIEAAKLELDERQEMGSASRRAVPVEVITVERGEVTEIGLTETAGPSSLSAYVEAKPVVPMTYQMHETPGAQMAELIERVVLTEGPVHLDEVIVRLRGAWGLQRAGGRIQASVERGLAIALQRGRVIQDHSFLTTPGQYIAVRDRSGVSSAALRRPEMLPPAEVEAGILGVVQRNLGASVEELAATVPRLLGFKATSVQLRRLVMDGIENLKARKHLKEDGLLLVVASGSP
jgi:very-short-patch-repair endonuclease